MGRLDERFIWYYAVMEGVEGGGEGGVRGYGASGGVAEGRRARLKGYESFHLVSVTTTLEVSRIHITT